MVKLHLKSLFKKNCRACRDKDEKCVCEVAVLLAPLLGLTDQSRSGIRAGRHQLQ